MPKLLSILSVGGTIGLETYLFMFSSLLGFPVSNPQAAASTAPLAGIETDTSGTVKSVLLVSAEHGGTVLNRSDAHAYLKINPGALKADYTFSVLWNNNPAATPSNLSKVSRVYDFKAKNSAGTNISDLEGRVQVCVVYDPNLMGSIVKENLRVYRHDGKEWKVLANTSLNAADHLVCGDTTHFSDFGVFGSTTASTPNVGGNL